MTSKHEKAMALVAAWHQGDPESIMYDACTDQPEAAWEAILEILKSELTEDQEAMLAAGAMEDLMVYHGPVFIDRIEQEAKANTRFNHLLGGVWRRGMPKEIWDRIEKARKEVW
jgi:hypothetical protein